MDDDNHKCKLLASLVDVSCDDGDSTFSEWIASLAGKNNMLLTEILHVCVVPTESVAYSERIIMPEERVISVLMICVDPEKTKTNKQQTASHTLYLR